MQALFPPSSKIVLPNLYETLFCTFKPTLVEPVKETIFTLVSFSINSPISSPVPNKVTKRPSGASCFFSTY